jgi:isopenicillin N synthase-like dioxygenase
MPRAGVVDELLNSARATVTLTERAQAALAIVHIEAARFFTQNEDVKRGHGSDDFNFGYRPYGRQYSVTPERPDENSSFTYWADDPRSVPDHRGSTVAPFLRALHDYWQIVADASAQILDELAAHYGYQERLMFQTSSYLEINWYRNDSGRELLQDRHEDGHLLTLATSDGPGLELETDGTMQPSRPRQDALLVMPGSVLTAMTDGQIPPLYHRVRNHHLPQRTTVLFLVNPPLGRNIAPYVEGAAQIDAAELARTSGAMFGLPPAPLLDQPADLGHTPRRRGDPERDPDRATGHTYTARHPHFIAESPIRERGNS